ncbi:MAG: GSCFA domain-containing protein [Flavobacteriales bacterium]|nr:GSCFA domain-containing protein [Flavobacteriales bacterium]MCW8913705.1 GSCFA domain-containing protein [Flavobacteriales bacterium]MCW8937877.1 GSCFA domain-containing protein [Flavobacteriales bacterium]MCW8940546.1 GSCFA domain-containing protein [Flavobacteriales bacterium]MCW8967309.1 GSCFA domain-containing protein [Flavobacteriales bacterium]
MNFSTPVVLPTAKKIIDYNDSLLILGSCFAENIGEKLASNKFNTVVNPFGIIYNPIAVANGLKYVLDEKLFQTSDLIYFNDKWLSLQHHGSFSNRDKTVCLSNINHSIKSAHKQLKQATYLFITFGSAWVYEHKEHGLVANCHKIPAKHFSKRLLKVDEIVAAYKSLIKSIKNINTDINVVFTVSPVRHTKDGLWENNLSKSLLHLSIKELKDNFDNCTYFPAYEIVMDELRDYRFFKDDLVHPSDLAVNYVWEKFSSCYFSETTIALMGNIQKIKQAAMHKPFDFNSEKHQLFIKNQMDIIKKLNIQFPQLNFEEEKLRLFSEKQ